MIAKQSAQSEKNTKYSQVCFDGKYKGNRNAKIVMRWVMLQLTRGLYIVLRTINVQESFDRNSDGTTQKYALVIPIYSVPRRDCSLAALRFARRTAENYLYRRVCSFVSIRGANIRPYIFSQYLARDESTFVFHAEYYTHNVYTGWSICLEPCGSVEEIKWYVHIDIV